MRKDDAHEAFAAGYRAAVMHKNRSMDHRERHFEEWWRTQSGGSHAVDIGEEDRKSNNGHPGEKP